MISPKKLRLFQDRFTVLRRMLIRRLRLGMSRKKVIINDFRVDSRLVAEGAWIHFQWKVENAWKVQIVGITPSLLPEAKVRIRAAMGMEGFTLLAHGPGGPVERSVRVTILPAAMLPVEGKPTSGDAHAPKPEFGVPKALRNVLQTGRSLKFTTENLSFRKASDGERLKHEPPAAHLNHALERSLTFQELLTNLENISTITSLSELESLRQSQYPEYSQHTDIEDEP